jgi:hypothetical protein
MLVLYGSVSQSQITHVWHKATNFPDKQSHTRNAAQYLDIHGYQVHIAFP